MRQEEDSPEGWRAVTFYQLGAILHDLIMRRRVFHEIDAPSARVIDAVRHSVPLIESVEAQPYLISLARNCLQKNWRLRLELVHWEDFMEPSASRGGASVKERIRKRIAAGVAEQRGVAPDDPRSRQRALEDLAGSVASSTREICLESGTFPPIEIVRSGAVTDQFVTLKTGPSNEYALGCELRVQIKVNLLDHEGLIVRLAGFASVGTPAIEVQDADWISIYSGEASAAIWRDRLDEFLHVSLDAAQNAGRAAAGSVLRLDLE
jgi:hypothetical protein